MECWSFQCLYVMADDVWDTERIPLYCHSNQHAVCNHQEVSDDHLYADSADNGFCCAIFYVV